MSITLMSVEERNVWLVAFNHLTGIGCGAEWAGEKADLAVESYRARLVEADEPEAPSVKPETTGPFGEPVDRRGM